MVKSDEVFDLHLEYNLSVDSQLISPTQALDLTEDTSKSPELPLES